MIKNYLRWFIGFGDCVFIEFGVLVICVRFVNWIFIVEYKGNDKDMDVMYIFFEVLIYCVEDFEE